MSAFHSQFGEDRILAETFRGQSTGFCVEVGANDGVNDSNTYHFEQLGWHCVLVEPNPDLCGRIREVRTARLFECAAGAAPGSATLHVAEGSPRAHGVSTVTLEGGRGAPDRIADFGFASHPIEVEVRTLDWILEAAGAPCGIDFVSIDVEGFELAVLQGFDLSRWRPAILLLEDNFFFSDRSVRDYLATKGYVPFRRTGVNDWYAHTSNYDIATAALRCKYASVASFATFRNQLKRIPGLRRLIAWARALLHAPGTR